MSHQPFLIFELNKKKKIEITRVSQKMIAGALFQKL
jgi:hypothetical protein